MSRQWLQAKGYTPLRQKVLESDETCVVRTSSSQRSAVIYWVCLMVLSLLTGVAGIAIGIKVAGRDGPQKLSGAVPQGLVPGSLVPQYSTDPFSACRLVSNDVPLQ